LVTLGGDGRTEAYGAGASRRRSLLRASPTAGLLLAAVGVSLVQGAFFLRGQIAVGALLAGALLTALPIAPAGDRRSRAPLIAGTLLAIWVVARGSQSGSLPDGARAALLLAALGTVVVLCRRLGRDDREILLTGLICLGVVVAAVGWAAVVIRAQPFALPTHGLWRAASTLTYANATAALLVPLALVTASLLTVRRSPALVLALTMLLTGVFATLSRGGCIALATGLVLLLVLRRRSLLRPLASALAGASVAFAGLVPSIPGSETGKPALAVAALAAGLVIAVVALRSRTGLLAAVGMVALAGLALGGVIPNRAASRLWERRVTLDSPSRTSATSAALRLIAAHPLAGVGPGRGVVTTPTRNNRRVIVQQYIHDEYLQVLVEDGVIGGLLLAGLLAGLAGLLWQGRAHAPPELWAGVAAACVAGAIAAAFDFLWHIPAVPLVLAVLIGLAVTPAARADRGPRIEGGSA
jgi:hypothetical protein